MEYNNELFMLMVVRKLEIKKSKIVKIIWKGNLLLKLMYILFVKLIINK